MNAFLAIAAALGTGVASSVIVLDRGPGRHRQPTRPDRAAAAVRERVPDMAAMVRLSREHTP